MYENIFLKILVKNILLPDHQLAKNMISIFGIS